MTHISFSPIHPHPLSLLPPKADIGNKDFSELLLKARTSLAELKGSCRFHPNPMLLLSPAIIKEAVASSNIENINTTIAEALQGQLFPESEQRKPDKEVLHYRNAALWGFDNLKKIPISTRLILGIQHALMPDKPEGYRQQQNRIANDTTGEVLYTPPAITDISRLMNNWENFVNSQSDLDPLIKCALAHYQFEAIHPFGDGNGRTGRILMVLQLVQDGLLPLPILYISGYINQRRTEYYRLLRAVTTVGAWHEYIEFMLTGFWEQAVQTTSILEKIGFLFVELRQELKQNHKSVYSTDLVQALFAYPIIIPARLARNLNVHFMTASKYLQHLAKAGILKEQRLGKYHLFINHKLLEIMTK
ncbi:MAG: Fic family protein [Elusimicrobia bacterium]|nr:Fic family protein [Elusimicrobiota bacterium]